MKSAIRIALIALTALAISGCAEDAADTSSIDLGAGEEALPGAIQAAKADGAFGAAAIAYGDTVTGSTQGDAIVLYVLDGTDGDRLNVEITRTSGDLSPSAYLYRGTTDFVSPTSYDAGASSVSLNYELSTDGEHHIVAKAYKARGAGDYSLTLNCTGGPCSGAPQVSNEFHAASLCIDHAARCAIDGVTAPGAADDATVWAGCLTAADSALGIDLDCTTACDIAGAAETCSTILSEIAEVRSFGEPCGAALGECLDSCSEFAGFYGSPTEFSETEASTCWLTGYTDTCPGYTANHLACGGSDYSEAGANGCFALCASTEGAWDEGPWDGCTEACYDICTATDGECTLECENDADPDACLVDCMGRYQSSDCLN